MRTDKTYEKDDELGVSVLTKLTRKVINWECHVLTKLKRTMTNWEYHVLTKLTRRVTPGADDKEIWRRERNMK